MTKKVPRTYSLDEEVVELIEELKHSVLRHNTLSEIVEISIVRIGGRYKSRPEIRRILDKHF